MRGDILFIPCDGEGCERLIPGTPTKSDAALSVEY
mgnify:FL=1